MLGRVMGCLEQVVVPDGFGPPVYLATDAGKAPLGEPRLGRCDKIEAARDGPGPRLPVTRVLGMDAARTGVATLRAVAKQDRYHSSTALDDNQGNPRKGRAEGRPKRYAYGDATLRDCRLEPEDSREKGYLVVVRAGRSDWDYGKRTVLRTRLPKEAVGASLVVKADFDRWPYAALQFRRLKSLAGLNRGAGSGTKQLPAEKVRQAQQERQARIPAWQAQPARSAKGDRRAGGTVGSVYREGASASRPRRGGGRQTSGARRGASQSQVSVR